MTKQYDIIHLPDGFMYGIDKPLRQGATCHVKDNVLYDGFEKHSDISFSNNPSLGLPLLPDIKESTIEIWNKACEEWDENHHSERVAWMQGYKAASAKKYTEEDLLKLVNKLNDKSVFTKAWLIQKIKELQSLSPKPIAVEVEMLQSFFDADPYPSDKLKLIENKVVVKQWIFDGK